MSHELTKAEKKIARILIDKGLEADFKIALDEASETLSEWKQGKLDNNTAYHKLFKELMVQNEFIARRYDDLRGSNYLMTVAQIYADGLITEDDIKDFSDQTKATLNSWLQLYKK